MRSKCTAARTDFDDRAGRVRTSGFGDAFEDGLPREKVLAETASQRLQLAAVSADVSVHLALEQLERDGAGVQHDILECTQRELVTQCLFCLLAYFDNFELADHVRAGLTGEHGVAFHVAGFDSVVYALLAR